jgi:hypothetical protein
MYGEASVVLVLAFPDDSCGRHYWDHLHRLFVRSLWHFVGWEDLSCSSASYFSVFGEAFHPVHLAG